MRIKLGNKHLGKVGEFKDPNTGYVGQPRKKYALQNPTLPRNRVDVNAYRTGHGEDFLEIKVFSTHGEGMLAAKAVIRPSQFKEAKHLVLAMEVAGGAGAEHLAEAYGDDLDPEVCAKYAKELGIEALKKINERYTARPTIIT